MRPGGRLLHFHAGVLRFRGVLNVISDRKWDQLGDENLTFFFFFGHKTVFKSIFKGFGFVKGVIKLK